MKILLIGGLFNAVQVSLPSKNLNLTNPVTMMAVKNQNAPLLIGEIDDICEKSIELEYHHYNYHCHGPAEHPNGKQQLVYFYESTSDSRRG